MLIVMIWRTSIKKHSALPLMYGYHFNENKLPALVFSIFVFFRQIRHAFVFLLDLCISSVATGNAKNSETKEQCMNLSAFFFKGAFHNTSAECPQASILKTNKQ